MRMTQAVFVDGDGVVHYRQFNAATVCGRSVIMTAGRTVQERGGLPLTRVVLPPTTCMECLAMAEDPAWA